MNEISSLYPANVWAFFHEITQIPRPSKHEQRMIDYLLNFARENNLSHKKDDTGNVLIVKPASVGKENAKPVVLQAHMDMVCEKNADVSFDFYSEPIAAYVDGDFVKAKGTTLGGDNGIGMAFMLAILSDNTLQHPELECLFTVDEETGLTGAFALGTDFISAKTLINLDSEDDGVIFIGCAGGIDSTAVFDYSTENVSDGYFAFRVRVSGLKGGHSGDDINKGLANANKLLARYLCKILSHTELRLSTIDGGNLRNAIPREANALVLVPYSKKEFVRVELNHFIHDVEMEFAATEPGLKITLESEVIPEKMLKKEFSDKLFHALNACQHGVVAMSVDMPGLVETSTNLASVKMNDSNQIIVTTSQRSSSEPAKVALASQIESVFALAGAAVSHGEGYPGWKPNLKSEILQVSIDSYKNLFQAEPEVRAIHAGLECGLFLKKYPALDMVSIGPQMYGVHSPDERLSISSTRKCWEWLLLILKNL